MEHKIRRILVVDDSPTVRQLIVDSLGQSESLVEGALCVEGRDDCLGGDGRLESQGGAARPDYELLQARDGLEAKATLSDRDRPIDIVVTDVNMPGLGGLDLMQWAQEQADSPAAKATWIILTGLGVLEDAIRAVQLGAFDFVCKTPELISSLQIAVRNALRIRRLNEERAWLEQELEARNEALSDQVTELREQAVTIEDDLGRAELIQRALLPRVPPAGGLGDFAVDAVYRPSHNVGGDLYDVVWLDQRHIGFYVADATGHGVAAAMLAVQFKNSLQLREPHGPAWAGQAEALREPADVLRQANERLLEQCQTPGMFITAAYGRLNTETGELVIASAGHPPLLLSRTSRPVELICRTGPALGLFGGSRFSQAKLVLEPGDQLLLYTDGLCQPAAVDHNSTFEQISAVFDERRWQGQDLLHRLEELASASRDGAAQEDDITILLLAHAKRASAFDNGSARAVPLERAARVSKQTELLIGEAGGQTVISILGGGRWMRARVFHQAATAEVTAGRPLIVDLSSCTQLDSTFLGTIQEVVSLAKAKEESSSQGSVASGQKESKELTTGHRKLATILRFQGLLPEVRAQFAELGMDEVLARVSPELAPLPDRMEPLAPLGVDEVEDRWRLVLAHEALAMLNQRNHQEFVKLIERFRSEAAAPAAKRELAGRT